MLGYQAADFDRVEFSVVLTDIADRALSDHLFKGPVQEDLTFAYWRPSRGGTRYTAVMSDLALPRADGDRILQGNVAFTDPYLERVLAERPRGCGIALLHSHLGPGWQDMSGDDIIAERDRLAGIVCSTTGLPLLGLTWGNDGAWSARFWLRSGRHQYSRKWASSVRVVGSRLNMSFHPTLCPVPPPSLESQAATISVWGSRTQANLARTRVGIVGLGSVGSIVAEAFSRTGFQDIVLIDHDRIEVRNLDRTLGAFPEDATTKQPKVAISKRLIDKSHTAASFSATAVDASLLDERGLAHALDCDLLLSCVDRPWPRHVLNTMAYAHLIPIVDGGILARVNEAGKLLHVDWRIHTVGPGRPCLYCIDAIRRSDVALDRDGKLDDPDYLKGLSAAERERYGRRNVFAFSLSVAAHQVLQAIGLVSGNPRIGGTGPQTYYAYPGVMEVNKAIACVSDCDVAPLTATACSLMGGGDSA
jgi:hypothetical protein